MCMETEECCFGTNQFSSEANLMQVWPCIKRSLFCICIIVEKSCGVEIDAAGFLGVGIDSLLGCR